jgi:hypothetical protein
MSSNSCIVGKPEVIRFILHEAGWRRFFRCSLAVSNFRASGWPRISQVLKAEGWDLTWELWQWLHAVHHELYNVRNILPSEPLFVVRESATRK